MEQVHVSTFKLQTRQTYTAYKQFIFSKSNLFYYIYVKAFLNFPLFAWVVLEEGKKRRLQGRPSQQRGVALMVGGGRKSQDLMLTAKVNNSS